MLESVCSVLKSVVETDVALRLCELYLFVVAFSLCYFFFFFFSSRRRHTRSKRDWSSDVCSSDLRAAALRGAARAVSRRRRPAARRADRPRRRRGPPAPQSADGGRESRGSCGRRSEERRVGKGWRSRWGRGQEEERE